MEERETVTFRSLVGACNRARSSREGATCRSSAHVAFPLPSSHCINNLYSNARVWIMGRHPQPPSHVQSLDRPKRMADWTKEKYE